MSVGTDTGVCIAGLGAIPGLKLGAVSARNKEKAEEFVRKLAQPVPVGELCDYGDIVVECAPAVLLSQIAEPVLARYKKLIVLSVGALLSNPHLKQAALDGGGTILVPTGALLGLDAVLAAAKAGISERSASRIDGATTG